MTNNELIKISKFLSLVLRHKPEKIGLKLDEAGWVKIGELLSACVRHNVLLNRQQLDHVVVKNDKQRFAISPDGSQIRASQGHSVEIQLGYEAIKPPNVLYHGTAERFLGSILSKGLVKGKRHHVHLSRSYKTAAKVGQRHGRTVVLEVDSDQMGRDGFRYYRSENGVWLTDHVPVAYLSVLA